VEEHRKEYIRKAKERERQVQKKRVEQDRREKRMQELKLIWEGEVLPNWD